MPACTATGLLFRLLLLPRLWHPLAVGRHRHGHGQAHSCFCCRAAPSRRPLLLPPPERRPNTQHGFPWPLLCTAALAWCCRAGCRAAGGRQVPCCCRLAELRGPRLQRGRRAGRHVHSRSQKSANVQRAWGARARSPLFHAASDAQVLTGTSSTVGPRQHRIHRKLAVARRTN